MDGMERPHLMSRLSGRNKRKENQQPILVGLASDNGLARKWARMMVSFVGGYLELETWTEKHCFDDAPECVK